MGWYSWAAWIERYINWLEQERKDHSRVINKQIDRLDKVCESMVGLVEEIKKMDAKIRKIEKESKKTTKDLKDLEKMDKKRDKFVEKGKEKMKKGC